eukprot:4088615-Alexandrium_andersonii.AAC.1
MITRRKAIPHPGRTAGTRPASPPRHRASSGAPAASQGVPPPQAGPRATCGSGRREGRPLTRLRAACSTPS